ncbi:hypothetical protein, partial [Agrobacterium tumefaciens]|uniref:hypothetical protein n=1 Tax=Agrobacterium tumefaciens TaxID=358 RepID=UPI002A14AAB4
IHLAVKTYIKSHGYSGPKLSAHKQTVFTNQIPILPLMRLVYAYLYVLRSKVNKLYVLSTLSPLLQS